MMSARSSLRDHTIFAPRFRSWVSTSLTGFVAGSAASSSYFTVWANSLYRPFSTANPITTTGLVTLTLGSTINAAPAGYSTMAAMYGAYKVVRARITVRFSPGINGDDIIVIVYPIATNDGNPALQPFNATSQPYARSRVAVLNSAVSAQTVRSEVHVPRILGLTRTQYECLPFSDTSTQPESDHTGVEFAVSYSNVTGALLAANMACYVTLDQEVEWAYPRTQTN